MTMKKLFTFIAVSLSAYHTYPQTQAGNMMLGGSVFISSQSNQNNSASYSALSFSPSFGYFLQDNLAIGATILIGSVTTESFGSKGVTTDFGLGPFVRYYKFTSNENFAFFGQAQVLFVSRKDDDLQGGGNKSSTMSLGLSPGFAYFATPHWAIDFSVTALSISSIDPNRDADNDKTTTFDLNISLAPSLGIRYHFGN